MVCLFKSAFIKPFCVRAKLILVFQILTYLPIYKCQPNQSVSSHIYIWYVCYRGKYSYKTLTATRHTLIKIIFCCTKHCIDDYQKFISNDYKISLPSQCNCFLLDFVVLYILSGFWLHLWRFGINFSLLHFPVPGKISWNRITLRVTIVSKNFVFGIDVICCCDTHYCSPSRMLYRCVHRIVFTEIMIDLYEK